MKILLIEDNPADVYLIRDLLSHHTTITFEFTHIGLLSTAVAYLKEEKPDIILSDLGLPDSRGMETFVAVMKSASEIPIIVLTGLSDEESAVTAVRKGAQDYLVKGNLDMNLLARSILYSIERKKLLSQLERSLKEIKILKGMIPICAWCRKLRDDDGYWKQVETYLSEHTRAEFTHGICPECAVKLKSEMGVVVKHED